jgi:hypothetical protein
MQPGIIDTVVVGIERDGTPVYASERDADFAGLASCILWAVEHPGETFQGLAWAVLTAGCVYLVYDAFKPTPHR